VLGRHTIARPSTEIFTAFLVSCLALTACSSSAAPAGNTNKSEPLEIGIVTPLSVSASYAVLSTSSEAGALAYIQQVNAAGGVDGSKVVLNVEDDAAVGANATASVEALLQKHVLAILGFNDNECSPAIVKTVTASQTPMMCFAVDDQDLIPPQADLFSNDVPPVDYVDPILAFTKTKLHPSGALRVADVTLASPATTPLQQGLATATTSKYHWDLVANIGVSYTATNIASTISQVIASHPDVIVGSLTPGQTVELVQALNAQNLSIPIIMQDTGEQELAAKSSDVYILREYNYLYPPYPTAADSRAVAEAGSNKSDINAAWYMNGYVQAEAVVAALRQCGASCTPSRMAQALHELSNVSTGGLTIGPISDSGHSNVLLNELGVFTYDPSAARPQLVTQLPSGSS
jgi:branched-chain amino acid transport system substrate-binding protein